jgi:predicted signal transduction protein with EAL and GGDEF domain
LNRNSEIRGNQSSVGNMLASKEDIAIVAEGAETPAHIKRLLALGDVTQGYSLARPTAANEARRWMSEFRVGSSWLNPADGITV